MSTKLRKFDLYLDENFPAPAGKFLKKTNNVISVAGNKSLQGLSDLTHLKRTNKLKRIFVALDKDFRTNLTLAGTIEKGCGVILVESCNSDSNQIIKILTKRLRQISKQKINGKICRISIDKIVFEIPTKDR